MPTRQVGLSEQQMGYRAAACLPAAADGLCVELLRAAQLVDAIDEILLGLR